MGVNAELVSLMGPQLELLLPALDERSRRLVLAAVALAAGEGGVTAVAKVSGASWQTVADGVAELASGQAGLPGRVRRPGAGRKKLAETDPGLVPALLGLVEDSTRGDPESPLAWTTKSGQHLADALRAAGHRCSPQTAWRLLHELGFSTQANAKVTEGRRHPDRDAQFRYIAGQAKEHLAAGQPVISVDAKKKEQVGQYAQAGREWRPMGDPVKVRDHGFSGPDGHAIPYGVYDVAANTGFVNVGTDHNTAAFAVESIRRWWDLAGRDAYPGAARLLVTCDAGGGNGWRNRAWKAGLAQFARDAGLEVTVCHFPPGTSKWNKIEHRLFSQITLNWRGRPLASHDIVVNTIAATTTRTGLTVTAVLDRNRYPKGTTISDEQARDLEDRALMRHGFHGGWNYTLLPVLRPAPDPPPPPAPSGPGAAARAALAPVTAALASPELTGLSREDLAALAAALELPAAAAREQRLHLDRGRSRQARTGPAAPFKYPLDTQLLTAIYHHRHGMPVTHIAALLGAHHSTISEAVQAVTALLGPAHPALAPGPERIRTPAALRACAATAGITIPEPPPPGRLRIAQQSPATHRKHNLFWNAPARALDPPPSPDPPPKSRGQIG
jgi:Rhodopirellula transposase DDE domain